MSLSTPQTVRKLQAALHAKAKGSPTFRFYSLYDKVYRTDVLAHAYAVSKANGHGQTGISCSPHLCCLVRAERGCTVLRALDFLSSCALYHAEDRAHVA